MRSPATNEVVIELNHVDEMFNAPDTNPFSTREVETFGEAGITRLQKRIQQRWPRRPRFTRLTLRLPPDQITPNSTAQMRAAIQRYCEAQIEKNHVQRRRATQIGLRQLVIALMILLFDVMVLYWVVNAAGGVRAPSDVLPGFVRGVLIVLVLFAGSLTIWDAIESLAFNWVPFVLDDASYWTIRAMDVVLEPSGDLRDTR
jgi:hypothetical protein